MAARFFECATIARSRNLSGFDLDIGFQANGWRHLDGTHAWQRVEMPAVMDFPRSMAKL
jgi:hypothetical protein